MLSFPLETTIPGETPMHTAIRLLHEEVGVSALQSSLHKVGYIYFPATPTTIGYGIDTFVCHCTHEFQATPVDTDIVYAGWMHPARLMGLPPHLRRREVVPILSAYCQTIVVPGYV